MAWLATLDSKAATWPTVIRWPYLGLKWLLILLGVYLVLGLAYERNGLGAGVVVACLLAGAKGLIMAFDRSQHPPQA